MALDVLYGTSASVVLMTLRQEDDVSREVREAVKEAMREYIAEQQSKFGRFSLQALFSLIVVAFLYIVLAANGWSHK